MQIGNKQKPQSKKECNNFFRDDYKEWQLFFKN